MNNDLLEQAKAFAHDKHRLQIRKGAAKEPYIQHVSEVVGLVTQWGASETIQISAWLHDVVEDCPPTSCNDISELFGPDVASIVAELTDDKSLPKSERKSLQVVTAPKKSYGASLIKIADKSSNLSALINSPPDRWEVERIQAYIEWAYNVVSQLQHKPELPMIHFMDLYYRCKKKYF
jgi:(p)ppGpp synthase/HD superfamily hydrolase